MSIVIGFTGTRQGLTPEQSRAIKGLLLDHSDDKQRTFIHGDCIGADEEAFYIAAQLRYKTLSIPCDLHRQRAFTKSDIALKPMSPLSRNKIIVDSSNLLIACPAEDAEIMRSGTWSTIRYAKKQKRRLIIISPTGVRNGYFI